jgi:predicted methyltransferase
VRLLILVAALLCVGQVHAALDWDTALNGAQRSEKNKQRDQYRNPRATLEFFGLREDMSVVEISPGGGWYTEILTPLVREKGKLYAAHYSLNGPSPYYRKSLGKFLTKLGEGKSFYQEVIVTQLQPPFIAEPAPAGSADLVLTFRNVHNWINSETVVAVLAAAYKALKPGGVLGVVEHRAVPGTSVLALAESGYVLQKQTIDLVEAAGFKLAASSEINANPLDTTDHPEGVWTLPPGLRLGEVNREQYLAIGESDRMTLKFIKP